MNYVIMCGGIGERMWPLGSPEKPKQFHAVVGDKPLIVQAVERLRTLTLTLSPEGRGNFGNVFFSTTAENVPLIKELFPDTSEDHFIVEPSRRDTGPAMAYVAARMMERAPDEPVAFIPSDHVIKDADRFVQILQLGEKLINETGRMLDIGVTAAFASTVLGYTKVGNKREEGGITVYDFLGHTEKPDLETATEYVKSGEYLWHASYYMWTPRKIMGALQKYAPELHEGVIKSLENPDHYSSLEKISFDYAITEHMDPQDVTILEGDFGWSDAGAWDTLYEELKKADGDNVIQGSVTELDSSGSLVHSTTGRNVGVIGLKDMVVVDTKDGLLVCPKDRAQDVKKLLGKMNE